MTDKLNPRRSLMGRGASLGIILDKTAAEQAGAPPSPLEQMVDTLVGGYAQRRASPADAVRDLVVLPRDPLPGDGDAVGRVRAHDPVLMVPHDERINRAMETRALGLGREVPMVVFASPPPTPELPDGPTAADLRDIAEKYLGTRPTPAAESVENAAADDVEDGDAEDEPEPEAQPEAPLAAPAWVEVSDPPAAEASEPDADAEASDDGEAPPELSPEMQERLRLAHDAAQQRADGILPEAMYYTQVRSEGHMVEEGFALSEHDARITGAQSGDDVQVFPYVLKSNVEASLAESVGEQKSLKAENDKLEIALAEAQVLIEKKTRSVKKWKKRAEDADAALAARPEVTIEERVLLQMLHDRIGEGSTPEHRAAYFKVLLGFVSIHNEGIVAVLATREAKKGTRA
jgi:hypothetical protein